METIPIQEINGFLFGHADDQAALTGCSVVLCENGAVGGVDVRGGAPGTRETDLLNPENTVETVHGIFLSGGSAYGLEVGNGVMTHLEEQGAGVDMQVAKVPIVPGAILFDLYPGDPNVRPDKTMGIQACENAQSNQPFHSGNVGAGTGATVGKVLGPEYAMRGGIGSYAVRIGELEIGAVIAVNAYGDVIDPSSQKPIAGAYDRHSNTFINTTKTLEQSIFNHSTDAFSGNTTIGTIVTNATMTKAQAQKLASVGHDGLARTIQPTHTPADGDTLFTLSTNDVIVDFNALSAIVVEVVEKAIQDAVTQASPTDNIPAFCSL